MYCSHIDIGSVRGRVSLPVTFPTMFCLVSNYQNYTIAITQSVCLSQFGDGQGRYEGRSRRQEAAMSLHRSPDSLAGEEGGLAAPLKNPTECLPVWFRLVTPPAS